jgi:hypothetical protein
MQATLHAKRGWIYALIVNPAQPAKAHAEFAAAVRLDPAHADAHTGLGYLDALDKKSPEAQHAAIQALLHGADQYLVLHNVACIYAELSQVDKAQAGRHQDLAMALIQRELEVGRRTHSAAKVKEDIREERSFAPLRQRADYQKLLGGGS